MSRPDCHPGLHPGVAHGSDAHFVPDGWEDLDMGVCPCGELVRWNSLDEIWVPDRSLRVLVLSVDDAAHLAPPAPGYLSGHLRAQLALQGES